MKISTGFTLLEVLVALAIFALVTLGLGRSTQAQLATSSALQQRALAEILAVNAMERARSNSYKSSATVTVSNEEIAGSTMIVTTKISETQLSHYLRITVEVRPAVKRRRKNAPLYRLEGAKYARPV